jgi:hypothetical protein
MARSYIDYSGNGSTSQFVVPFPFLKREHVTAKVNGVTASFTWINDGLIEFTSVPGTGDSNIRIRRYTPSDVREIDFTNGSSLDEFDLDTSALQAFYLCQESQDLAEEAVQIASNIITGSGNVPSPQLADLGKVLTVTSPGVFGWDTVDNTIPDGGVTGPKLAIDAVTAPKIADGAVTTEKYNDLSITGAKVAAKTIPLTKINAEGSSAGQIPFSNGPGNDVTWGTLPPNVGEANTASNIGSYGLGFAHSKSGVDLRFRKLDVYTFDRISGSGDIVTVYDVTIGNFYIAGDSIRIQIDVWKRLSSSGGGGA